SRIPRGLHNHLRESVEQTPLRFLVGLLAVRIAIPDAEERAFSRYAEADLVVRRRERAPVLVENFHRQYRNILAVRIDFFAVRGETDRHWISSGLSLLRQNDFAIFRSARFERAG